MGRAEEAPREVVWRGLQRAMGDRERSPERQGRTHVLGVWPERSSGVASSEAKKAPVGEGAAVTSTDWPRE